MREKPTPPENELRCTSCAALVIEGKRTCWCRALFTLLIIVLAVVFCVVCIFLASGERS